VLTNSILFYFFLLGIESVCVLVACLVVLTTGKMSNFVIGDVNYFQEI